MAAYISYTLWMKTLFRGWPVMVHDTHMRRRRLGITSELRKMRNQRRCRLNYYVVRKNCNQVKKGGISLTLTFIIVLSLSTIKLDRLLTESRIVSPRTLSHSSFSSSVLHKCTTNALATVNNNDHNSNTKCECTWWCHHGRAITRVHPVHLMNVEWHQAAANPSPSQTT